jgi:hypothetical protein
MNIAFRILRPAIRAAAFGAAWIAPIEAYASVSVCEKMHIGEIAEDKSELLAKKRALENWVAHASRYGEQYARWGIAWDRRLDCTRSDTGLFRCKALARPCAIRQVPPVGLTPLRRGERS